jgi:hypothetical protein
MFQSDIGRIQEKGKSLARNKKRKDFGKEEEIRDFLSVGLYKTETLLGDEKSWHV